MRVAALVVVWVLVVAQDAGGATAALFGHEAALRARDTASDVSEEPSLCFSLRHNEDQLLCSDRRSSFNFNPFGLRFGKRFGGSVHRRTVKRAKTKFSLFSLFPRELEVPT